MRTLPLVLLAVTALIVPTVTLAAGSTTPVSQAFVITGLVLGDQKADASGKIGLEGDQLYASVGCNSIGGKVGLDGDTVTITDSLVMTQMACPGTVGQLEDMFVKLLQHGPFRITADAWVGDGASILVQELASGPIPNASAPDEPVGSSPGAVITDPFQSCPPLPSGLNGTTPIVVGPGSVGGGSSGSGSSGSGSGSAAAATAIPVPGSTGDEPPVPPDPGQTPDLGQKEPEPSFVVEPGATLLPEPPPTGGVVEPDPGFTGGGTDPGTGIGTDPGVGKPVILDPCVERMYAVDAANGTGGVAPKAAGRAEHAGFASSDAAALVVPIGVALALIALVAFLAARRWRAARLDDVAPVATVAAEPEDPTATPR